MQTDSLFIFWWVYSVTELLFSCWIFIYLSLSIFTRSSMNTLGPGEAYIDGLVEDCSNSSALAMELLQSCTKPSIRIRNICHHFSGYGLWPVRRHAITCNDFKLLSVLTPALFTKLSETWVKMQVLIQENVFENSLCKISVILLRLHCVKLLLHVHIAHTTKPDCTYILLYRAHAFVHQFSL